MPIVPSVRTRIDGVKANTVGALLTWAGALHVPAGGTKELVLTARTAATKDNYKGQKGPNGGVVQRVGDDVVEIVGDKGTGQVRVYALDATLKPIIGLGSAGSNAAPPSRLAYSLVLKSDT